MSGGAHLTLPRGPRPRRLRDRAVSHIANSLADSSGRAGNPHSRRKHPRHVTHAAVEHELHVERLPNVSLEPYVALDLPSTSGRSTGMQPCSPLAAHSNGHVPHPDLLDTADLTMEELFEIGEIDLGALIAHKIQSSVLLQDLLEVVYVHGDDFDPRHTPQALQRLATLYRQCWRSHTCPPGAAPSPSTSHPPPPGTRLPPDLAQHMQHLRTEYLRPALRLLSRLLLRSLSLYEPRDVATSLWSLAVLDHPDPHLLDLLARRAHFLVAWFKPQDISNTFWAFARLGLADNGPPAWGEGGLLQRLLPVAQRQLPEFKPKEVASLAYSLAAMGRSPGQVFMGQVVAVASAQLPEYGGRELSNVMWALAKLRHQERPFLKQVALHLGGGRAAAMEPADVSMIVWSFARLGFRPKALLTELPSHLAPRLDTFAPQDLVCLLTTYSILEFCHPALFNRAADTATARLHTFSPPELVHLLWAYGRFGVRPAHPHFLRLLGDRLLAARDFLTPQALALVAKSLARLRLKHEGWLADLSTAATAKMDFFPPDALSRLLWGFSWLQHHDAPLLDLSLRRLKDMYDQYWRYKVVLRHLTSVVASCDRLGARPVGYRYFAELAAAGHPTPYMRWMASPPQLPPRPKMDELVDDATVQPVTTTTIPDSPLPVPASVPEDPDLPTIPPPAAHHAAAAAPAPSPHAPLTPTLPLPLSGGPALPANGAAPGPHLHLPHDPLHPHHHARAPGAPSTPALASHILPAPHHYITIPSHPLQPHASHPPPHPSSNGHVPPPATPTPPHLSHSTTSPATPSQPDPTAPTSTPPTPPPSQPLPSNLNRPNPPPGASKWAADIPRPQLPPRT